MPKKIFVTGGAGYIGSHTCVELLKQDYEVMIFDDLSNGYEEAVKRIELITNKNLKFVIGDIRDEIKLQTELKKFQPDTIIHFAGLKSVGESSDDPLLYYDVNVRGSINILKTMSEIGCNKIVFSSSATVYDNQTPPPYKETDQKTPVSPYGRTKLIFEMALEDWVYSKRNRRAVVLRYFNPVGAHESGLIGEAPYGSPNNLMPFIAQVANKKKPFLSIFGDDYLTRDGTGERDFIHVVDLAQGHVKSLKKINELDRFKIINLGTGVGTTVLELINSFEKVNRIKVPFKIVERRQGDIARSIADPTLSSSMLGFSCKKTIEDMCADTWNWQIKNPKGYNN